jgi:hypothetical protein
MLQKPVNKQVHTQQEETAQAEEAEPQLPPLPNITITMEENNMVLHSEASFRELDLERPSEGTHQELLRHFTNTPKTGNLVQVQSSPQRLLV